jgi:SAM-dependent methyltransferase
MKVTKLKNLFPWQIKIIIKLLISRFPFIYKFWHFFGIFIHGNMDNSAYAYSVYRKCYDLAEIKKPNYSVLEIGPGDSLSTAVISRAFDASKTWLLDSGDYASHDMSVYEEITKYVQNNAENNDIFNSFNFKNIKEILQYYNAVYLTQGLRSLAEIPDESVDFIFSNAVLEHIQKDEFQAFLSETNRILASDGVCVHCVDLRDHLAYALNNLRFSEKFWESNTVKRGGFYTNRIRYNEMLNIFIKAGFDVFVKKIDYWNSLPTSREKMNEKFRFLSEDDLRVSSFTVVLKKTPQNTQPKCSLL